MNNLKSFQVTCVRRTNPASTLTVIVSATDVRDAHRAATRALRLNKNDIVITTIKAVEGIDRD